MMIAKLQTQLDSTPDVGRAFSNVQEQFITYCFVTENFSCRWSLDIGCGEGYGTYKLAEVAEYVVGADISLKVLQKTKERYKTCNIYVAVPNAMSLGLRGSFGLIVPATSSSILICKSVESSSKTLLDYIIRQKAPPLQVGMNGRGYKGTRSPSLILAV